MQNAPVTPSTTTVRAATEALRDVFTDTGTRWPLDEDGGFADLTNTGGVWDMLNGGYYDHAGIPSSEAFRTMLAGYIADAANAAELDYLIDTDEDEHVDVSVGICALMQVLEDAVAVTFDSVPGSFSGTERAAAKKAFFAGDLPDSLMKLVVESIEQGYYCIGEDEFAEYLAAA